MAEPVNYDAYLFTPVIAGIWKQHELWDGTYTLGDLLDAHEMLQVKQENEFRAREAAEMRRTSTPPVVNAPKMKGRR